MSSISRAFVALTLLGLLAACGGSPSAQSPTAAPAAPAATAAPAAATAAPAAATAAAPAEPAATAAPAAASAGFPRTIAHSKGEITLEKPAVRVAALEWTYVEDLLAIGVQPVAVADIEGYNDWVKTPVALDAGAQDVGGRGEPNLEKLAAIKPDLIIDTNENVSTNYEALVKIAPVLVFTPYSTDPKMNQYAEMSETLLKIAAATGRDSEGQAALAHMDATFADLAKKVAAAGQKDAPFILSQAWSDSGAASIRLFTETAMATQIIERLGLKSAWTDKTGFQQYGFSSVSIEALPQISEKTHFFYVVQANDNPFEMSAIKPLWESLPFVKAGNAHALGGDTWLFGGPLSAEVMAGIVANTLVPNAAAPAAPAPAAVSFPLTLTDAAGVQHTFEQPPKIGCTWYGCIEMFADMGIPLYASGMAKEELTSVFYSPAGPPEHLITDESNPEAWAAAGIDVLLTRVPPSPEDVAFKDTAPIFFLHHPSYGKSSQTGYGAYIENLKLIGQLTGKPELAAAAIARFETALTNLKKLSTPETQKMTVGVLFQSDGYLVITPDNPFCAALATVGLGACVSGAEASDEINPEQFLTLNPTWIVYQTDDKSYKDRSDPIWPQLSAVKDGHVYDAKGNRYYCCSTRGLIHALQEYVHYVLPAANMPDPGIVEQFDPTKSPLVKPE